MSKKRKTHLEVLANMTEKMGYKSHLIFIGEGEGRVGTANMPEKDITETILEILSVNEPIRKVISKFIFTLEKMEKEANKGYLTRPFTNTIQ